MSSTAKNADSSGHLLRSGAEIAGVLEKLAARREMITVQLAGDGAQFSSRIIHADPTRQFIIIMTSANKSDNGALLALPRVTLVSAPADWHIEFVAIEPREVMHEGTPAIRLRYPEVLSAQRRRRHPRIDVPPKVPLRCIADAGGITPFDAQIVDISLGGISMLLHSFDIILEPGTALVGCRIEVPEKDPVTVDLEVRYSEVVKLPDGSRARRSGFRFVNAPDDVKQIVAELDKH